MVLWWQIVLTIVCIFLSGTFSGLTLGLMSLDLIDLRVISESGTEKEKWYALRILPIRRHGNWLLCTLLIGNTAVNSALAIFTAGIFGGIVGFLSSTFIILYMGEIIPQAVCHRFGLIIGAHAVPFVRLLMYATAPLSFTTAKALDFFLGGEPVTRYNRSQLKSLLTMHGNELSEPDPSLPSHSTSFLFTPPFEHEQDLPPSSPANEPVVELRHNRQNPTNTISDVDVSIEIHPTANPTSSVSPPPPTLGVNPSTLASTIPSQASFNSRSPPPTTNRFNPLTRLFSRTRKSQKSSPSKRKEKDDNNSSNSERLLTKDELTMVGGAFDFSQKTVGQVMTSLNNVFMLDASVSLNFKILLLIFQSGHSRIPIYSHSRENIIGLLFAKDLILLDPEDSVPIRTVLSFFKRTVFPVNKDIPLNKMLNIFCQGGGHMAIVRKESEQAALAPETIGIVTLEDLIEELIGQDIVDETDVYTDNLRRQRVKRVRSIDPDVLRMFDSTHDDEILSKKEVSVVASYLSNNAHEFSDQVIKLEVLRNMLAEMPIIECHGGVPSHLRKANDSLFNQLLFQPNDTKNNGRISNPSQSNEGSNPTAEEDEEAKIEKNNNGNLSISDSDMNEDTTIYSKGVPTKNAYLIIHGKLQIVAGDDEFVSDAGPWTILGLKALTQDLYAPDFTTRVVERPTRVLRISRKLYRMMVRASGLTDKYNLTGVPSRALSESRISEQPALQPSRSRRGSNASRSSPSLAVAAAEAAMAVGTPADVSNEEDPTNTNGATDSLKGLD